MNVTTKITPEVFEAMSAADLIGQCRALAAQLGPRADVTISIIPAMPKKSTLIHIRPNGIGHSAAQTVSGNEWADTFAAAREWIATHKQVHRNNIIRKMALAIISITDEFGECAEARLRAADFAGDEITEFHEAACARAGEMCQGAPFSVLMEG